MSFAISPFSARTSRAVWLLGTLVMIVASLLAYGAAQAASVGEVVSVDDAGGDPGDAVNPKVAQDPQGNIHVVWDSNEGSRKVRYAKGIWNGSNYSFGQSYVLADVGSFGYSAPSVAVARNGTVIVGWSDGSIRVRTWNASSSQPGGQTLTLPSITGSGPSSGVQVSVTTGPDNRFHVIWNGDFQVQYCEWDGARCTLRLQLGETGSSRPDITADTAGNIHVVSDSGQRTLYRARAAGTNTFSQAEDIGGGNFAQIAADGQGNVHIVRSGGENTVYCQRKFGQPCTDARPFDFGSDLQPTIGVTRSGTVLVVFRDATFRTLAYNIRENGQWSSTQELRFGNVITIPDLTQRPFSNRFSLVFSQGFDVKHVPITGPFSQCDAAIPSLSGAGTSGTVVDFGTGGRRLYLPIVTKSVDPCAGFGF